jgi:ArsR family transcriptional regulator
MLPPTRLYACLSDEVRLHSMLLLHRQGELCVCELMAALQENQSKVSRHLAQLRNCGLLLDRRQGQWVFYRLHPELPPWARAVLEATTEARAGTLATMEKRLLAMQGRPERAPVDA